MGNAAQTEKIRAIAAAVRTRGGNNKSERQVRDFVLWRLARWEEAIARGDRDELVGVIATAAASIRPSAFGWESIAYVDAARVLQRALTEAQGDAHAA